MVGGDKPPTFLFYKHEKTYIYINIIYYKRQIILKYSKCVEKEVSYEKEKVIYIFIIFNTSLCDSFFSGSGDWFTKRSPTNVPDLFSYTSTLFILSPTSYYLQ